MTKAELSGNVSAVSSEKVCLEMDRPVSTVDKGKHYRQGESIFELHDPFVDSETLDLKGLKLPDVKNLSSVFWQHCNPTKIRRDSSVGMTSGSRAA